MSAVLERTNEQRRTALLWANEIRARRADLKRNLRAGGEFLALVYEPPEWLRTMKVYDLLRAVPRVGRVKADVILRGIGASHSKTIGGLSERQRCELLTALAARGAA